MRKTKQIRVSEKWHAYAQAEAERRKMPMSYIVDDAFKYYSGVYRHEKKLYERWIKKVVPNLMRPPYHDPGEAPGGTAPPEPLPS